jgi:hypothetical protein
LDEFVTAAPLLQDREDLRRVGTISTTVLATAAVFLYWLLFENIFFFFPDVYGGVSLVVFTNAAKLGLPFALLAATGLPPVRLIVRGASSFYLAAFAVFLAWAAIPTIISGNPVDYAKFLPRFVFFLAVLSLFSRHPKAFLLFSKWVVVYVLIALVQWILVYATAGYDHLVLSPLGTMFAGPFGLFGNITGRFYLPGIPVPIVRLAGFWNEPTHASASAFAGFFLARRVSDVTGRPGWRQASWACLIAGFLTLSNAGYLAIGAAALFGTIFDSRRLTLRRTFQLGLFIPMGIFLVVLALAGRQLAIARFPDNVWIGAIAGFRGAEQINDPTAGRTDLAASTLRSTLDKPIGQGVQVWGEGSVQASGSAPLLWLLLTGVPGLVIILFRESMLILAGRTAVVRHRNVMPIVQSLIVVMTQQLSYGTWMDPGYFCLAAAVLAASAEPSDAPR